MTDQTPPPDGPPPPEYEELMSAAESFRIAVHFLPEYQQWVADEKAAGILF